MSWILDRETSIYSRVKAQILSMFDSKYPQINVTQDDSQDVNAKFPSVYIAFLQPYERGADLQGNVVNAVSLTAEVHVYVTKAQGIPVADEIAWGILDIFKAMSFNATMPAIPTSKTDTTYETVARYTRVVGYNDVI